MKTTRIAIACQGGGSHTAFTAGALTEILRQIKQRKETNDEQFEIVGLSGTSGGAICALLTWYGLINEAGDPPEALLRDFWDDVSATGESLHEMLATYAPMIPAMFPGPLNVVYQNWLKFSDGLLNEWVVGTNRFNALLGFTAEPNPYNFLPLNWEEALKGLLKKYVNFDNLAKLPDNDKILLMIGAINASDGEFQVFSNWTTDAKMAKQVPNGLPANAKKSFDYHKEFNDNPLDGITPDAVLASACIPTMFPARHIGQQYFYDGLFSENPPIKDLPDCQPDEIWIIRVNPKAEEHEPMTSLEIQDRRNELYCNLSLEQEMRFFTKINELITTGQLVGSKYKPIKLLEIEYPLQGKELDVASKANRDPRFIHRLQQTGVEAAKKFFDADRMTKVQEWEKQWEEWKKTKNQAKALEKQAETAIEQVLPEVLKQPDSDRLEHFHMLITDLLSNVVEKKEKELFPH